MYGSQLNTPRQLFQLSIFFSSLQFHVQKKKVPSHGTFRCRTRQNKFLNVNEETLRLFEATTSKICKGKQVSVTQSGPFSLLPRNMKKEGKRLSASGFVACVYVYIYRIDHLKVVVLVSW